MSGFQNVISGLEHFPEHVREWLTNSDSPIANDVVSVWNELATFEKAHEKEQIQDIGEAGYNGFKTARAAGQSVGDSIKAGVAAAFATGIGEVKTLSTQAMTTWISGLAK
jgi:hypothetical protein